MFVDVRFLRFCRDSLFAGSKRFYDCVLDPCSLIICSHCHDVCQRSCVFFFTWLCGYSECSRISITCDPKVMFIIDSVLYFETFAYARSCSHFHDVCQRSCAVAQNILARPIVIFYHWFCLVF